MSFVPVTGHATFRAARPPRDSVVEFRDGRRVVSLPVKAALPVLARAPSRGDSHPSVLLLGGAVLLGLRLVSAGRFEPHPERPQWRLAPLSTDELDRIDRLAEGRAYDGVDGDAARELIHRVLEAVVDAVPPRPPAAAPIEPPAPGPLEPFAQRLEARLARRSTRDTPGQADGPETRPQLVSLSLRVEADEEELVAGSVRVVVQVHDDRNPLHVCEAAQLWADTGPRAEHGFGERARTHATIALQSAAEAWPPLERLLALRVPDEITLDTDELVGLLDHGVEALRERGVDVLWPRGLGRDLTATTVLDRAPSRPREEPLETGLFGPDSLFSFSWQLALHGDPLTSAEMDQLASAARPIVKLRGQWLVVDPAMARRAKKRLVRHVKPVQAVAAALTGVVDLQGTQASVVVGASLLKVREQLRTAATREPVPVPARLRANLRDYQRHGLTWLAELTSLGLGACLADDMGLGKTVTLIALHLHRRQVAGAPAAGAPAPGPTLVVCPASLLGNWEAELGRFASATRVRRFHGAQRSLAGLAAAPEAPAPRDLDGEVVLTTYGTMQRGAEALAAVPWGLVVADEAQHVKNPQSQTARQLRSIPSAARVALTGTPVENNLTELWAILDWATPGLLGSRNAFRKVWAAPIESGLEPTRTAAFADLIAPFLLRRRKSDPDIVPELPPKTETDHLLGLTREQAVLYETFVRDTMERIERADEGARRGLVLALLTGLKQICNHPAHFLHQHATRLSGRSEKFELVEELLTTIVAEGGAALVFTQYVALARLLERHLESHGIPHQLLHGGTPVARREELVARFQAGPEAGGVPVFLLSLRAGGTGLNLTRADHVIHVDRWWNPAVEEQATDRAHRIGQTRPVQVHRLVTRGTIEERVAELLTRKRALADAVLARGEAALTELDDDDLRSLVSLRRDG